MKFYFAPLEGITGYICRNAQHTFFENADKYFTPFIATNQKGSLKNKELRDILPENNTGLYVVPQILTNNAEDFIETSKSLLQYGYREINLNLGCPSGTVVSKNRGSGFLALKDELDRFLDRIYSASVTEISIKTRIGKDSPDEFPDIMELYNKYPLKELIIHPRIQKDFYKNTPNLEVFGHAFNVSRCPVCYNGDIFQPADYQRIVKQFPQVDKIMLGRGMLMNPNLIAEIKGMEELDSKLFQAYHDMIYKKYKETISGERNVLFKMKELWSYMAERFPDKEKCLKIVRKSQRLCEYETAVISIFGTHK